MGGLGLGLGFGFGFGFGARVYKELAGPRLEGRLSTGHVLWCVDLKVVAWHVIQYMHTRVYREISYFFGIKNENKKTCRGIILTLHSQTRLCNKYNFLFKSTVSAGFNSIPLGTSYNRLVQPKLAK